MTELSGVRVLLISRDPLDSDKRGNGAYVWGIVRDLRENGAKVFLLLPSTRGLGRRVFAPEAPAAHNFDAVEIAGGFSLGSWLVRTKVDAWRRAAIIVAQKIAEKCRLPVKTPGSVWDVAPTDDDEKRAVAAAIAKFRPTALIANYFFLAEAMNQPAAGLQKLAITHDLFHLREEKCVATGRPGVFARVEAAHEYGELAKADALINIQSGENEMLRAALPGKTMLLSPAAFPLTPPVGAPEPFSLMLVGSHSSGNIQGLEWFLDKVWPLLRARAPRATLYIYGGVAQAATDRDAPGVIRVGPTPSLTEAYHRHALCVVPLLLGSGLKVKLVEAMCHGRASVVTSIGAQGVEREAGASFLQADDPEGFSAACAELLSDDALRARIEARALDYAQNHFTGAAAFAPLRRYLAAGAA